MIVAGTITIVILTAIAVLAGLIYFRNPEKRRTCFRSWMNLFGLRRGDGRVQYCRVCELLSSGIFYVLFIIKYLIHENTRFVFSLAGRHHRRS